MPVNELDVLFPSPVPLGIGGRIMQVLPVPVRRLGDLLRAVGPVQGLFGDGQVDLDALLQSAQALEIIRIGLGVLPVTAQELTADERHAAMLVVLALNETVLFPAPPADDAAPPEHALTTLLQRLIESGHRWPDIMSYTFEQAMAFDAAAARLRRDARHDALIVGRAAVSSPEIFRQVLKDAGNG